MRGIFYTKMKTMTSATTIIKHYKNGGTIEICADFAYKSADYYRVYACCKHFAKQGKRTIILPRINHKNPLYKILYKDLIGTKYEHRCPDFCVDGVFYEHEGFRSQNSKRAFNNMCNRGFNQSENIILDDCNLKDSYMIRSLKSQIKSSISIHEVWILRNGKLRLLFKAERR